ncbi:MAG: PadR family transcriptional regulator [Alphaproteobacteria bacterium]
MTHTDSNETQHPREGCGRRGRGGPKAGYGPRGQHRAKRALKHGDLKFFIIALLKDAPRHGYDMMTEIEALSKGAYKPSPGVMYPALNLIQDMGWATTEDQNGKKTYSITGEGVAALAENEERITAIYERLERLSQPKETGEARPLRMALDGLRHDVKSYMRQNRGDEVKREKLAKIIAKARAEIAELTEVKNT